MIRRINDIECMLPLVQEPNSRSDVFGCTVAATHIYPPRTCCYSIDDMDGEAFVAFGGNGITLQRTYTALDFHTLIGCMYPGTAVISTYVAPPANSFTEPLQIMTFSTSPSSYSFGFLLKNKFKYCSSN